jgi:signal transduction histidine kinase
MQLEAAQKSLERDTERARTRLTRAHELARQTLADVRRSVWTLASPLIDGEALTEALEELSDDFAARTGLPISYRHTGATPALSHAVATQTMRIFQEALHNIEKHAQASAVVMESEWNAGALRISVRDDGVGFDPSSIASNGLPNGGGFGLANLQTRAQLAGGVLHIASAPGEGTTVTLMIQP